MVAIGDDQSVDWLSCLHDWWLLGANTTQARIVVTERPSLCVAHVSHFSFKSAIADDGVRVATCTVRRQCVCMCVCTRVQMGRVCE